MHMLQLSRTPGPRSHEALLPCSQMGIKQGQRKGGSLQCSCPKDMPFHVTWSCHSKAGHESWVLYTGAGAGQGISSVQAQRRCSSLLSNTRHLQLGSRRDCISCFSCLLLY